MQKKIKYLDPSIERKKNLTNKNFQLLKNSKFPLPSEVEISESGVCNRKCSFCPRSAPDFNDFKRQIEIPCIGNHSLLFKRTNHSWHGVRRINCPENKLRQV